MPGLITQSLAACDAEIRQLLMANVVLCGGGSLFAGFAERLNNELSRHYHQHVRVASASIPSFPLLDLSMLTLLDATGGENTRAGQPDGAPVWWVARREHPRELGNVPPALDQQGRVAGEQARSCIRGQD